MTNREEAKGKRNGGTCVVLVNNAGVYSTDVSFKAASTKMQADTAATVISAAAAAADNTGYSADKMTAKQVASTLASQLCAVCQVKLDMLGNQSVSQALNGSQAFYLNASDALCASRLQNVHDVMETNAVVITTDYITAPQLGTLQTNITTFTGFGGSTTAVNTGATGLTKQFKADMKMTDADIVTIKKLLKKYEAIQPAFYNAMVAACKIPAITVRHTYVNFAIVDEVTGDLLANVRGTLSKSKETPVSNLLGVMAYTTVPAGGSVASFALPNYITKLQDVDVKRGKTNNFSISLTPGTMTKEAEDAIKAQLDAAIAAEKAGKKAKRKSKKAGGAIIADVNVTGTDAVAATATPTPTDE